MCYSGEWECHNQRWLLPKFTGCKRKKLHYILKEVTTLCKEVSYSFHPAIFMCSMKLRSRGTVEKTWSISALSQKLNHYNKILKTDQYLCYHKPDEPPQHVGLKFTCWIGYYNNQVSSIYLVIVQKMVLPNTNSILYICHF